VITQIIKLYKASNKEQYTYLYKFREEETNDWNNQGPVFGWFKSALLAYKSAVNQLELTSIIKQLPKFEEKFGAQDKYSDVEYFEAHVAYKIGWGRGYASRSLRNGESRN